ncbi:MAG: hypothetical protein QXU80_03630, partial [Zestosphaera sp.]
EHLLTLLAGLVLAGPIAAIFIRIIYVMTPAKEITFSLVFPVLVGIMPNVLGVLGAGASASVGRSLTSIAWVAGLRIARRLEHQASVVQASPSRALSSASSTASQVLRVRIPRPKLTSSPEESS